MESNRWAITQNTYNSSQKNIIKSTHFIGGSATSTSSSADDVDLYSYNSDGNLISKTESGMTTKYSYDYADYELSSPEYSITVSSTVEDVSNIVDGDGNIGASDVTSSVSYDVYGNIVKAVDASGSETTYTYDLLGRNTKIVRPGNIVTSTYYGYTSNYITETNELGGRKYYSFDSLGRNTYGYTYNTLKSAYVADYRCEYDNQSRLSRYTVYIDGSVNNYVKYEYYDNGSLKSEKVLDRTNRNVLSYREYEYNAVPEENVLANFTRLQNSDGEYMILGEYTNSYGHKLKDTIGNSATDEVHTKTYTTDLQGNILTVCDFNNEDKTTADYIYKYDCRFHCISSKDGAGTVSSEYLGNLVTETSDRKGKTTTYAYDERGLVSAITEPFNTVSKITKKYYDINGNLARIEVKNNRSKDTDTFDVTEYR
ncbi:MAG: hypothetical protein ACI4SS_05475, partial [Clostridia bacterium]